MASNVVMLDSASSTCEMNDITMSRYNVTNIKYAMLAAVKLVRNGVPGSDIGITVPYTA